MPISSYYSKLGSVWESSIQLKPTHTCTCNDIQPWCDYDQMEYVMHFLMGLNEAYSSIRGLNGSFSLYHQDIFFCYSRREVEGHS